MKLYGANGTREIDTLAASDLGLDGETLMERAGGAALDRILERWPETERLVVLAGGGNNAGDGYVLARRCRERAIDVGILQLLPEPERGPAGINHRRLEGLGVKWLTPGSLAGALTAGTVLVDAVFGTGLTRAVEGTIAETFTVCSAAGIPRVALDIPSGLCADTGAELGTAFKADLTVTFIAHKLGLWTGAGPGCAGSVVLEDLGVSRRVADTVGAVADAGRFSECRTLRQALAPRRRDAHKGDFGHVLVVGGYEGMPGAVLLAGEAAARTGAGLVSVATWPGHAPALVTRCPTLMLRPTATADDLAEVAVRAGVIALGPGLGRSPWSEHLFAEAMARSLPMVVDADALNLLAGGDRRRNDWILTPHPGEAARLLDTDTASVQADRIQAARSIARVYGGVCVLKGAGTVVVGAGSADSRPFVCTGGNPGMGSGGMGDVLTGILAGLVAQRETLGLSLGQCARLGVLVHAEAGDRAARAGERGLLAHDLLSELRAVVNRRGAPNKS